MAEYIVNAYRIREIITIDFDQDNVSFLIEDGPNGSDDVLARLQPNRFGDQEPPKVGDYWVNPFGIDGHYVPKAWFEQGYKAVTL
ncbi:MAG TPA: hypothetical protein VFW40_11525 [Capsulimonadaceae bacterium]|nr:hypothetical protein [Capsulimonadaceae bacterium]